MVTQASSSTWKYSRMPWIEGKKAGSTELKMMLLWHSLKLIHCIITQSRNLAAVLCELALPKTEWMQSGSFYMWHLISDSSFKQACFHQWTLQSQTCVHTLLFTSESKSWTSELCLVIERLVVIQQFWIKGNFVCRLQCQVERKLNAGWPHEKLTVLANFLICTQKCGIHYDMFPLDTLANALHWQVQIRWDNTKPVC